MLLACGQLCSCWYIVDELRCHFRPSDFDQLIGVGLKAIKCERGLFGFFEGGGVSDVKFSYC